MMTDELFVTPVEEAVTRAVRIAQEAWDGEPGDAAEQAYQDQLDRSLAETGLTVEELETLGAPRSWLGRLMERAQDWWWDRKHARESAGASQLEALFAFPIPLLQTKPLQDTPYDYDQVDQMMAEAAAKISAAIATQTGWVPVPLPPQGFDEDDFDFDPVELIQSLWRHPAEGRAFVLIIGVDDDPKILGHNLGLVHLPVEAAGGLPV